MHLCAMFLFGYILDICTDRIGGFHADENVFIDTSCAIARSVPVLFMLVVG